jgi:integrase
MVLKTARRSRKPRSVERARAEKPSIAPLSLHECRHTFASLMIAAGVNAKALSRDMGHVSITVTLDRYGHLMPGNEDEAAALLDAYPVRADTAARMAVVEAVIEARASAPAS